MDRKWGSNAGTGGESSQEYLHTEGEHVHHSDNKSGAGQQDGGQDDAPEDAGNGSSTKILSLEELSEAIKLGTLSRVQIIVLDRQHVGSGHFMVAQALASGQMSALSLLSLQRTRLDDDCSEATGNALASAKFPCLRTISFSGNEIGTKGVEALGRAIQSGNLKQLATLWLMDAGINDRDMATLATAFQYGDASVLPNLEWLKLDENRFTGVGVQSLADALKSGRLDSLQGLWMLGTDLSQEGATAVVSAFAENNSLSTAIRCSWGLFPELERQYYQLRRRNGKYKDIQAGLAGSSMVKASFGKIYLCGDPNMGKTTLCHTLKRTSWESLWTWERRPHLETRTRGIDITEIRSKGSKKKHQGPISLSVWDMAGQQDYHLVHNAFFPALSFSDGKTISSQGGVTLFVIVCNCKSPPEEVEKQLDYWLRYIASSFQVATKQIRHVFVVLNKMGGVKEVQRTCQYWEVLLQEKRDKFTGLLNVHTDSFLVDVRRRGQVNALKTRLLEHSRELLKKQIVPKICDVIQSKLPIWSKARKEFPVLGWDEFLQRVEQVADGWPHKAISSATRYLDESGVLIFVDKSFPAQWDIPSPKLIILDPNWFCKEIIGNMFLSEDMVKGTERSNIFRNNLDPATGSISKTNFEEFFEVKWGKKNCISFIAILLWLGLCYKDKEDKLFIPSLIDGNLKPGDAWRSQGKHEVGEEQWVMGFSIQHRENEMSQAPMSLWHRFQVQIAQSPRFNSADLPHNDFQIAQSPKLNTEDVSGYAFVAGKYSMMFTVEDMSVRIKVNAGEAAPKFDEISVLVTPLFREDKLDMIQRKQLQVNLADELVNVLLDLWDEICGGVKYVLKVVWPWPASQSRPVYKKDRNVEVAEVKKWLLTHGMGRRMQWLVGRYSAITEDQLLSTKEKTPLILNLLRHRMQEAVSLRIYPPELIRVIEESENSLDGNKMKEAALGSDGIEMASRPTSITAKKVARLLTVNKVLNKLKTMEEESVERTLQEEFAAVVKEQKSVFRELQDTHRFFKEDKERTCPNLIYLGKSGERGSGVRATLKESLSTHMNARLQFACEAMYGSYRPHQVKDQQGLVVSELQPFLKIVPWLKVSLTVLLISAELPTNFVAPGAGFVLPDFQQWQQRHKNLSEGIVWATGYSLQDLDNLTTDSMGLDPSCPPLNPQEMYRKSRAAITNLIGKLSQESFEEKFGLRKVRLGDADGSRDRVVWICTNCHNKFSESNLVSDL